MIVVTSHSPVSFTVDYWLLLSTDAIFFIAFVLLQRSNENTFFNKNYEICQQQNNFCHYGNHEKFSLKQSIKKNSKPDYKQK